jgi:predicted DNA-binding transcriptional regulator YafY
MRADRLVAILLLLQARGQVTAAEMAEELEVSERTARRDLEALGMAGVPIYSQQGRNGGWRLAGGGRTDLSGLTASEARALFLVAGPSPVSATPQVKAALRKLVRALPEPLRARAEAASAAMVVDPGGWDGYVRPQPPPPLLDAVQSAVVEGQQVTLGYVARNKEPSTRVVHPLGLAAKGTTWYLVADTDAGLRTFRVDRMTSVEPTGDAVVRPEGFELAQAWRLISDEIEQRRTPLGVVALASAEIAGVLPWIFGNRVRIGPAGADGRVEIELRGHHLDSLAHDVAGFGNEVEVVEPDELRQRLRDVGHALVATYGR